jgi:hypothetical protein
MSEKKQKKSLAEHAKARNLGTAAYQLVDISALDPQDRRVLVEDARAGGGTYGLRVVEEAINGGASAPIYGFYKGTREEELWNKTKEDFGLEAEDVADDAVYPSTGLGVEITDPRREAALREAAAQAAEADAAAIRAGEDAELREITGETDDERAVALRERRPTVTGRGPATSNIVDPELASNATNEAAGAGPAEDNDEEGNRPAPSTRSRRTPR